MSGPVLITGATGKQGSAVVRALLKLPQPPSIILALTRSISSFSAQKLASTSPSIKLVEGNLENVPAIFDAAEQLTEDAIWGVYSVQVSGANEEKQGKSLVDESLKRNVKHVVYSSVDRGGNEKSWINPTNVPHYIAKHKIELHLRDTSKDSGMTWTILRPVAFMDNLVPGFQPRVFLAALKCSLKPDQPLQWVATRDIGVFAAKAFEKPKDYSGKAIGLAGDELTVQQTGEVFKAVTGQALTPTFTLIGSALKLAVSEIQFMLNWFGREGYGVDIEELRKMHPALADMKTWIVEDSKFERKK